MKSLRDFFQSAHRAMPSALGKARIAILISGRGSNMRALLEAIRAGKLNAECALVLSDRDATGLAVAQGMGIRAELFAKQKGEARDDFDSRLAVRLKRENLDLIVCAGYLRIISQPMLSAFPRRIINIHPSLLPAFPGLKAQKQALDYGVKITGCTVHLVDTGVDTGKILAQAPVPVLTNDNEATLSRRILKAEHDLYWRALSVYWKTFISA